MFKSSHVKSCFPSSQLKSVWCSVFPFHKLTKLCACVFTSRTASCGLCSCGTCTSYDECVQTTITRVAILHAAVRADILCLLRHARTCTHESGRDREWSWLESLAMTRVACHDSSHLSWLESLVDSSQHAVESESSQSHFTGDSSQVKSFRWNIKSSQVKSKIATRVDSSPSRWLRLVTTLVATYM